jgi:uncharacterized protein (TIGR02246 family)
MSTDELAIRQFLTTWFEATANDDVDTLLSLTTEDIVFLTPFKPPMDRAEFAREVRVNAGKLRIEAEGEFEEVTVSGDMGYGRGKLTVTITPKAGGLPTKLSGYALSVFRKQADGRWLLSRDANLLAAVE